MTPEKDPFEIAIRIANPEQVKQLGNKHFIELTS